MPAKGKVDRIQEVGSTSKSSHWNKFMGDQIRNEPARGRVLICGLGLRVAHMTLETLQALKKCRRIFHDFLDKKAAQQLRDLCGVMPVDVRGSDGRTDPKLMPGAVLAAAAGGDAVAFLCYGHPLAHRGAPELLLRRCRTAGIDCRVTAAVSSLDDILIAVGAPAMHRGLQIHPARALGPRTPLQPAVAAIVMSLDGLWTPAKAGVARFVNYLGTVYPQGHKMALIHCAHIMNGSAMRLETELSGLTAALEKLDEAERHSTSLFIPWLE